MLNVSLQNKFSVSFAAQNWANNVSLYSDVQMCAEEAMNLGWAIAFTGKVRRGPITTQQNVWKRPQVKNPEVDRYRLLQLKTQKKNTNLRLSLQLVQSDLLLIRLRDKCFSLLYILTKDWYTKEIRCLQPRLPQCMFWAWITPSFTRHRTILSLAVDQKVWLTADSPEQPLRCLDFSALTGALFLVFMLIWGSIYQFKQIHGQVIFHFSL